MKAVCTDEAALVYVKNCIFEAVGRDKNRNVGNHLDGFVSFINHVCERAQQGAGHNDIETDYRAEYFSNIGSFLRSLPQ